VVESSFHAHKDLLVKRSTLLSNVFENDLDQTDRVVPLHMADTDAYAFRLMLEYLYTGDIPDNTLMAQYAIPLAQNAHYLDTDELYKACIDYLRENWRKVQQLDAEAFKKDTALPHVEETLNLMQPDAIEDKLFFLAAVWHAECDEQAWRHIVEPQISTPDFIRGLSHKQLLRLQDSSQVPDNDPDNSVGMSRLLGLIPAKVLTAAVERDAAADKTKKLICTRCRMPMTPWLVNNDPAGCTSVNPTVALVFSFEIPSNHQPKHTVPAEQHSEQASVWAAPRFGAAAFGTQT
jgi:BTB/POZ domain